MLPRSLEPYFSQWMDKLTGDLLFSKADIAVQLAQLSKERERLLVLATKHCPNNHHDFAEIKKLAGDA